MELRRLVGTAPLWLSGAAAVILREAPAGPEVLLVRRSDTGEWSLVSGIVDPGEHPATTAVREAREEAGVEIVVERMLWLVVGDPLAYPNGDRCQFLDHGFLAHWVAGEALVGDEESTAVGWFPVDALPQPQRESLAPRLRAALSGEPGVRFEL